jgi:hypothetical protein
LDGSPRRSTINTLDAFLDGWTTAERHEDAAATARLLTDDFVGIGPVGFVLDKAAWLRRYGEGLSYDSPQAALQCLYLTLRSLDPTGQGGLVVTGT